MRKFRRNSLALSLGVWLLIPAVSALAQNDSLASSRAHYNELAEKLRAQNAKIASASEHLDQLSASIRSLKAKKRTLLHDYRLQSSMQEAQRLSDQLQDMAKERSETEASLRIEMKALSDNLDREIDRLREVAASRSTPTDQRKSAARDVERLNWERMQLSTSEVENPLPSSAKALMGNGDSPEEAHERIVAIRDFEGRLKREIASIEDELKQMRRQRFIRAEVNHLMDEEDFFGERGFVSGGPPRSDKSSVPSLTRASTGSTPSPANTDPTLGGTTANPPDTNVGNEAPATARSKLDPGSSLLFPTTDVKTRDPLAQLATEFGISSEQTRDLSARASGDMGDQIHWLQRRLKATKQILTLLEEKARKIEEKHSR